MKSKHKYRQGTQAGGSPRKDLLANILLHTYGVDVGNYEVKTRHCCFTSGYTEKNTKNELNEYCIEYPICKEDTPFDLQVDECRRWLHSTESNLDSKYYCLEDSPFSYNRLKTNDEAMFMLTLHGIAQESIARKSPLLNGEEIDLVVGTPIMYFTKDTKERYKDYYMRYGKRIIFKYGNVPFDFRIRSVRVLAQCFSATIENPSKVSKKDKVQVIDIGGITTDALILTNGELGAQKYIKTYEIGCNHLCNEIRNELLIMGLPLEMSDIIRILSGKEHHYPQHIFKVVEDISSNWFGKLFQTIENDGYDFRYTDSIFLGGGTSLLKTQLDAYIKAHEVYGSIEKILDTKANVLGYERFAAIFRKEPPAISFQEVSDFWNDFDSSNGLTT